MATGQWHGTKKCAVSGAKLPKANQIAGQTCPWCGNTIGAYIGATPSQSAPPATSTDQQLANLQKLHDDGLISDAEYGERRAAIVDSAVDAPAVASSSPPQAAPIPVKPGSGRSTSRRNVLLAVAVGVIVLVIAAAALNSEDGSGAVARTTVATTETASETGGSLSCQAYLDGAAPITTDISADLDLMALTAIGVGDGSLDTDTARELFDSLADSFADAEQDWRDLGRPPTGFAQMHNSTLEAIGKFEEAASMAARSMATGDLSLIFEATAVMEEGSNLIGRATAAMPSSC